MKTIATVCYLVLTGSLIANVLSLTRVPWRHRVMQAYVCVTPSDEHPLERAVPRALSKLQAYGAPPLAVYATTDTKCLTEHLSDDFLFNTIGYAHTSTAAMTTLVYMGNRIDRFKISIDPTYSYSEETLHIILMHELGHVYGLEHPFPHVDSVMGYTVNYDAQENMFLQLTYYDVFALTGSYTQALTAPATLRSQRRACNLRFY